MTTILSLLLNVLNVLRCSNSEMGLVKDKTKEKEKEKHFPYPADSPTPYSDNRYHHIVIADGDESNI